MMINRFQDLGFSNHQTPAFPKSSKLAQHLKSKVMIKKIHNFKRHINEAITNQIKEEEPQTSVEAFTQDYANLSLVNDSKTKSKRSSNKGIAKNSGGLQNQDEQLEEEDNYFPDEASSYLRPMF